MALSYPMPQLRPLAYHHLMLGVGTADSKSSRSTMKQRNQKGFEVGRIAFLPCKNRDTECDWRIRGILLYHEQNRNLNPWRQGGSCNLGRPSCLLGVRSSFVFQNTRPRISCSISMSDGHSGDNGRLNLDHIKDKVRRVWEDLPHPIKSFPWSRVQDNFIQFLLGIASAVIKYLSAPLLAVSALSEMSYCAHERKLFLVPVPLAVGLLVAGILNEAASELSPLIKDAEVPWHLIAIAVFFVLLKLPGPYYPYWGRMLIPHLANGALLRVFWMVCLWYQRPKEPVNAELEQGVDSLCQK